MRLAGRVGVTVIVLAILAGCGGGGLTASIQIITSLLPNAAVSLAYTVTLEASGGTPPYTWALQAGLLPPGLTLSSTGVISGTPTTKGSFDFTVIVDDNDRKTLQATRAFTLTVRDQLSVPGTNLPQGVANRAYNFTLTAQGSSGSLTWTVTRGTLPAGLTLSSSGQLTGTPTVDGSFSFTVSVADAGPPPQTRTLDLSLLIQPALTIVNPRLANGFVNSFYEQTLGATGGLAAYTWSIVNPAADPPGLDLVTTGPSVGIYRGTPAVVGTFTFTIRVTDTGNAAVAAASQDATFTVIILNGSAAYVANSGDGTVSVLDTVTKTVTQTITVGTTPTGVALTPDGTRAYVTNKGSNNVSVIDAVTNTVIATVAVGTGPVSAVVPAGGLSVYVANQTSNEISIMETITNRVTTTLSLPAGAEPTGLTASPNGRLVFLTLRGSNQLVVINNDPLSPAFHTVVGIIGTGSRPSGVTFAAVTSKVFVANSGGVGTVTVVDVDVTALKFNAKEEEVAVGTGPFGIGAGPNCNFVHVVNSGSGSVSVIGATSEETEATTTVGSAPQQISFTADGAFAFVTNSGTNDVSVLSVLGDTAVHPVVATIRVGSAPAGIALMPNPNLRLIPPPPPPNSKLPVASWGDPYAARVCAAGGLPPYKFEADKAEVPPGLNVAADGKVTGTPTEPSLSSDPSDPGLPHFPNKFAFTVTVTDAAPVPTTVSGDFLIQVCCFGIPPRAYVANFESNSVSVINMITRKVEATITAGIGQGPVGVAIRPDMRRTYVTNFNSDTVSVIDSNPISASYNQVVATVRVGDGPSAVAVTPDGSRAYVTNEDAGTLSVIDTATNSVLGLPITVGRQPDGIAIRPDGKRTYVPNLFSNDVSVIDTDPTSPNFNKEIKRIAVGQGPAELVVMPDGSRVYVTNQFSDSISVIDTATNTEVRQGILFSGARFPTGIAVTPNGARLYVADQQADVVSVVITRTDGSDFELDIEPDNLTFDRIDVGKTPDFVAMSATGRRALVTNFGAGTVSVVDTTPGTDTYNSVTETISVGKRPEGIAIQRFMRPRDLL